MPASAPHQFGSEPEPVADVIDFAARRAAQRRPDGPAGAAPAIPRPTDEQIAASTAWQRVIEKHGASLDDPAVRAAVAGITDLFERLVIGAQRLREGGDEGLDAIGAQTMLDLVADLRAAPATLDAAGTMAEEC